MHILGKEKLTILPYHFDTCAAPSHDNHASILLSLPVRAFAREKKILVTIEGRSHEKKNFP